MQCFARLARFFRSFRFHLVLVFSIAMPTTGTLADYPERPVKFVVPYAAGGPTDFVARTVAKEFETALGKSFIVENKGGANGIIGVETVVKAQADGYTLLFTVDSPLTVNPSLYDKISYEPGTDLVPVGTIATLDRFVLAVHPSVQAASLKEFVAITKANPGTVTMANAGNASPAHLVAVLFASKAGVTLTHVPYKGGAPATGDLVGGQVASMFVPATNAVTLAQAGKIRALAVTGAGRFTALPDVPTVGEAGLPQLHLNRGFWYGVFAPAQTPSKVIQVLSAALQSSVAQSTFLQTNLEKFGMQLFVSTPEELARLVQEDRARWAEVIRAAGIKLN